MTRRVPRAAAAALVAVVLAVAVWWIVSAGSAGGPAASPSATPAATTPAPSAEPDPGPGATVPPVPVQDASLAAQQAKPTPPAPSHLTLPTLGVDLPIDPVGVAPDGQMEIPPHAERAGWYKFGATPGTESGTAVIAAHVDSIASEGLGPFARLGELAPGETVSVTLADGTAVDYAVEQVASVPKPEVAWTDVFVADGPPRLVLVTCGGSWRSDARSYTDNVIVTLVRV